MWSADAWSAPPAAATSQIAAYSVVSRHITLDSAQPPFVAELHLPWTIAPQPALQPFARAFNADIEHLALELVGEVMGLAAESIPVPDAPISSGLWLDYSVRGQTSRVLSARLDVSMYSAGAAHPNHFSMPLNYEVATGRPITLAQVFRPGAAYLRTLSANARATLARRQALVFPEGVEPREENFRSWYLTRAGLELVFDPYQVAPYALGSHTVVVPWGVLRGMLRPGGPAAQFAGG